MSVVADLSLQRFCIDTRYDCKFTRQTAALTAILSALDQGVEVIERGRFRFTLGFVVEIVELYSHHRMVMLFLSASIALT